MQSSIWKIVSAVGIVGIGTLVVLEVQHRLPPAAITAGDSGLLTDSQAAAPEDILTPDSETDFDRLMSGSAPSFDVPSGSELTEPGSASSNGQFDADGSRALQIAAVDTTVRRDQLSDGMNPFPEMSSAGLNASEVKTVSYQQDQFFKDEPVSSATPGSGVAIPQEPVVFPAFGDSEISGTGAAAPAPRSSANQSQSGRSDRSSAGSLMFFGEDSKASDAAGHAATSRANTDGTSNLPVAASQSRTSSPATATDLPAFDDPFNNQADESEKFQLDDNSPRLTEPADSSEPRMDFFSDEPSPSDSPRDVDVPLPRNPVDVNPFEDEPFSDRPFGNDLPEPAPRAQPATSGDRERALPSFDSSPAFELDESRGAPLRDNESGAGGSRPFNEVRPRPELDRNREIDNDFPELDLPFPEPGNLRPEDSGMPAGTRPRRGSELDPLDDNLTGPAGSRPFGADLPLSSPGDLPSANVPESADLIGTETLRPHVSIRKNAPETASVGVPMDYTIVVINEGQSPAYDVMIEDQLGRGIELVSTRPTADYDRTNGRLSWQISQLKPAEKQEIVVRVTPSDEGTMDGVATVRFKSQVRATTVITAPRLVLELTGPSEVKLGDEVSFRYMVRNEGSGVARDVILRSVLPLELRHSEGRDLEYEIESLGPQEEREIQLTVIAAERAIAAVRNTAEVTIAGLPATTAESELRIVAEQLTVERLGPDRRYVGRTAQFQNIITNNTNFEALNAVVLEQVPIGMKFVSAPSGDFNPDTRVITWRLDRIGPGKQILLDVELMPETAGPMDAIVEVVENAGFRSKARKTVAVEDLHNVSADISRMDGPVAVGEKFTFTITVDNRGTATANEVQLTVQVPAQIRILAAGSREQGITARLGQGNIVVYNSVVKVEPNQQKTYQLVLQGQEPVRNGVVKAQLKYTEMQESLVVSESVTVYSDSL